MFAGESGTCVAVRGWSPRGWGWLRSPSLGRGGGASVYVDACSLELRGGCVRRCTRSQGTGARVRPIGCPPAWSLGLEVREGSCTHLACRGRLPRGGERSQLAGLKLPGDRAPPSQGRSWGERTSCGGGKNHPRPTKGA